MIPIDPNINSRLEVCRRCPHHRWPLCSLGGTISHNTSHNTCPEDRFATLSVLPVPDGGRAQLRTADELRPVHSTEDILAAIPLPGDLLATILETMGGERVAKVWTRLTGKPCHCKEHQEKINKAALRLIAVWKRWKNKGNDLPT